MLHQYLTVLLRAVFKVSFHDQKLVWLCFPNFGGCHAVFLSWFLDTYFAAYPVIVACCSQEMNGTTAILTSTICQPCLT
jgi:hypothetical protein